MMPLTNFQFYNLNEQKTMKMRRTLIFSLIVLFQLSITVMAQKSKPSVLLSKAEKMGYERSNKYWGPKTFYCYSPGKVLNKMADNSISNMRDLTGISREDFRKELEKQGFEEVPKTKKKTWYKPIKGLSEHYYSPDKTYLIEPDFEDLYMSPVKEDGQYAYATKGVVKWQLIPLKDSLKVVEAIWQFLRDARELKTLLGTFGSNFKKADHKAYPIQRVMSGGWAGIRAGTWLLRTVDGKMQGHWGNNEEIIRRTMGMPQFHFVTDAWEQDFVYSLMIDLTNNGYVLRYQVSDMTLTNLPPGVTWQKKYPELVEHYKRALKTEKGAVELYKKAPFPPSLEDMDKLLKIK